MQIEDQGLEILTNLSNTALERLLHSGLDELHNRLTHDESTDSKNKKIITLGIFYAKVFSLIHDVMNTNSRSVVYTPFRSNLLAISNMLKEDDEKKKLFIENFVHAFWIRCKCKKRCHTKVPVNEAFEIYSQYFTMAKNDKANSIGAVLANMLSTKREEGKNVFKYTLAGAHVCRDFFTFVYCATKGKIDRLQSCINTNKPFNQDWRVKDEWALPNANSSGPEYFIPINFEWTSTYTEFCKSYKRVYRVESSPLSWGQFHKFYSQEFDTFKKLSKKTNYCDVCCRLRTKLNEKSIYPIEFNTTKDNLNEHLMLAKTTRLAYSDHRLMTAKEDGKVVLSFDYAENILLPILSETPAQFYFKRRRKVELFGITNECTNAQVNFLVDECDFIGKGPNSTISTLDHYIHSYIQPLSSLILYSDNCPEQNKNAHMIGYLSYLTKVLKRHPRIEYYFMLSRHTKFSPDGHFGSIKRKLKMEVCQGITDLLGSTGVFSRSAKKKTSHLFIRTLLLRRLTLNGGTGKNTLAQNFYSVQDP